MSEDVLSDQFRRLLNDLPADDPWPVLEESGFLGLLQSEENGGAGLSLEDLFPLALEVGSRPSAASVIEAMAVRMIDPSATRVDDAEQALRAGGVAAGPARALAAALAAAQMAGAMLALQKMTIDYVLTRRQFGREIAKFQAVQHQVAVMAEEVMAARIAAEAAFAGNPLEISDTRAGTAKLRAGQAALLVCSIAHALHGAIGVSQEHSLHLYTRRLHGWRLAHGGESWWSRRLGAWTLGETSDFTSLARAV